MKNTPNRYTLILLKDYANLSQVKISPFVFWFLLILLLSSFLFCFISVIIAGFIWQNSHAIKLERDLLYKQYVASQVRINRLTALEDIVYKKNISLAVMNKRSDVEAQHTLLSQNKEITDSKKATSNTTPTIKSEDKDINESNNKVITKSENVQKNTVAENIATDSNNKKREDKQEASDIISKAVALRNIKIQKKTQFITLDMSIVNTSQVKQNGKITYTLLTQDGNHAVVPSNRNKNAFYSINRGKEVKTTLTLPKGVSSDKVVGLQIELLQGTNLLVRKVEYL